MDILAREEVLVYDWLIQWFGPDEESTVGEQSGTDTVPLETLNTLGETVGRS